MEIVIQRYSKEAGDIQVYLESSEYPPIAYNDKHFKILNKFKWKCSTLEPSNVIDSVLKARSYLRDHKSMENTDMIFKEVIQEVRSSKKWERKFEMIGNEDMIRETWLELMDVQFREMAISYFLSASKVIEKIKDTVGCFQELINFYNTLSRITNLNDSDLKLLRSATNLLNEHEIEIKNVPYGDYFDSLLRFIKYCETIKPEHSKEALAAYKKMCDLFDVEDIKASLKDFLTRAGCKDIEYMLDLATKYGK